MAQNLRTLATSCRQRFWDLELHRDDVLKEDVQSARLIMKQSDRFDIWIADTGLLLPSDKVGDAFLGASTHVTNSVAALLACLRETLGELHQLFDSPSVEDLAISNHGIAEAKPIVDVEALLYASDVLEDTISNLMMLSGCLIDAKAGKFGGLTPQQLAEIKVDEVFSPEVPLASNTDASNWSYSATSPPSDTSFISDSNSSKTSINSSSASDFPGRESQAFVEWVHENLVVGVASDTALYASFLPFSKLATYFKASDNENLNCLVSELCPPPNHHPVLICQSILRRNYLRTFATLIMISQGRHIEHFIREDFLSDEFLPFVVKPSRLPRTIHQGIFEEFQECQWKFVPEPMEPRSKHLEANTILPITSLRPLGQGAAAYTYSITIHPEYDKLSSSPDENSGNRFVMKTFRAEDENTFYDEVRAFRQLRTGSLARCDQFVKFYGDFESVNSRGEKTFNIILEHADGDLEWAFSNIAPPKEPLQILGLWTQIMDILPGILKLHNLRSELDQNVSLISWHQDIKPRNILLKRRGQNFYDSRFMFANLGLSHIRSLEPKTSKFDIKEPSAKCYCAPEDYQGHQEDIEASKPVPAAADIWSLGAVLSEVAVWITCGLPSLYKYRRQRLKGTGAVPQVPAAFYDDFGDFLPCVERWHDKVRTEARGRDIYTSRILDIVEDSMLVDESVRESAEAIYFQWKQIHAEIGDFGIENSPSVLDRPNSEDSDALSVGGQDVAEGLFQSRAIVSTHKDIASERIDSTTDLTDRMSGLDVQGIQGQAHSFGRYRRDKVNVESSGRGKQPEKSTESSRSLIGSQLSFIDARPSLVNLEPEIGPLLQAPPPNWPRESANQWLAQRSKAQTTPDPTIAADLIGRDHVFLIDDSHSMRKHWADVAETVQLLCETLFNLKADNVVEVQFASRAEKRVSKSSKILRNLVERYRPREETGGSTDLGIALRRFLEEYQAKMSSRKGFKAVFHRNHKPLSLYILTDGLFSRLQDVKEAARQVLKQRELQRRLVPQIGLQFIRFGDDAEGTASLAELDQMTRKEELVEEIIDVEPADGNVLKMLLGSINSTFDDDDTYI